MKSFADLENEIRGLDSDGLNAISEWLEDQKRRKQNPKSCFVIMPFSMTREGRSQEYWTHFFDYFIKPSLDVFGYQVKRSAATPENIVAGIMEELAWCDLVLAVLTDFNPNVWYELGVRHSLQRGKTIMICQQDQISHLPFDLRQHGVAMYSSSLDSKAFVAELRTHLSNIGDEIHDSPVSKFLDSGLYYCINRALACRRSAMRVLRRFSGDQSEQMALNAVDELNREWSSREIQLTIVNDDKILRHRGDVNVGTDANLCWKDVTIEHRSLYPFMKSEGRGLRLAAVEGCLGRISAIAFDTLPERRWSAVVESHINQGKL
jgi:hypothetical protein